MSSWIKWITLVLLTPIVFFACNGNSKNYSQQGNSKLLFEAGNTTDTALLGIKNWVSDSIMHNENITTRLDSNHKYGFSIVLKNLVPDAYVRVTVWKNNSVFGDLAFTSKDLDFRKYSREVSQEDENGWQKIILEGYIPNEFKGEKVKVFVMNLGKGPVYIDDLQVKVYDRKPYPKYENTAGFELIIEQKDMNYIKKQRVKSLKKGIITKKNKKKFNAILIDENGIKHKVEARIKGDWTDHIRGRKWSFRIKMKEGNFRGMKEFSIQEPGTRAFLNEWVLHTLFKSQDVLTTRYGFVPVRINGYSLGIYAYEEHFEKQLIESNRRREGPILKFDESVMWNYKSPFKKFDSLPPIVEEAIIIPFKSKKTLKNPVLRQQFLIAQNLLYQYKTDVTPISALFKVKALARLYALSDIGHVWHSLRWHNERFYYNPVSSKLELIGYDCYPSSKTDKRVWVLYPEQIYSNSIFVYDCYLAYSPFNDSVFVGEYMKTLHRFLFSDEIVNEIDSHLEEINRYEKLIQKEYVYYHYDYNFIKSNIEELKQKYLKLTKKLEVKPLKANLVTTNYEINENDLSNGFGLQGFKESYNTIKVYNYYSKPLYLTAYSSKERPEQGITYFQNPVKFNGFKNLNETDVKNVDCLYAPDRIYFKINREDTSQYKSKVMSWPAPSLSTPRQELLKKAIVKTSSFAVVNGTEIIFNPGNHLIDKPIIIAAGKKVIIPANTHLDFIKGSFFLSFSPVEIKGEEKNKVIIESSDGTGMGFTIIDAYEKSNISYTTFDGLTTLSYNGWNLTGAVTFYESDVSIENTEFLNNNCEDALNVIRSEFELNNSLIANTLSDGFDADFSKGKVMNSGFKNIGNDGIDYSGSYISIENVKINGAGDKGISGGESSDLQLKNIEISNANIGVASKDKSNVSIENIKLNNCNCGFAAYQKKMEYGPGKMTIISCEMKNVKETYIIGLESEINLDGDYTKGDVKLNIDSLYAR